MHENLPEIIMSVLRIEYTKNEEQSVFIAPFHMEGEHLGEFLLKFGEIATVSNEESQGIWSLIFYLIKRRLLNSLITWMWVMRNSPSSLRAGGCFVGCGEIE